MSGSPLQALRHRDFARMWTASVVSDVGTWMQLVAIGTLVASTTGSALRTGLVAVATFAPQGLASPFAGMLADRYDRRHLFLLVLAGQTVGALGLAAAVHAGVGAGGLTAIVLAQGIVGAAANPVAAAMLPDLIPRSQLLAASSLQSVSWNSGRILGPILATVVVGAVGPTWAILANAASFAILLVAIGGLRRPFLPAATDTAEGVVTRLRNGAATMRSEPTLVHAFHVAIAGQLLLAPQIGLAPIIATRSLGGDRSTTSTLLVALGIGSIVGSLSVGPLVARFGRPKVAAALLACSTAMMVAYANAPTVTTAALAVGLLGVCFIGGHICVMSVVPRDSPPGARGRIASLQSATMGLMYSTGVIWMGALGDATSLRVSLTLGGCAAALLLAWSLLRQRERWRLLARGDDPVRAAGAAARSGLLRRPVP